MGSLGRGKVKETPEVLVRVEFDYGDTETTLSRLRQAMQSVEDQIRQTQK